MIYESLATKSDLKGMELRLTLRMGGMLTVVLAILVALKIFS
ncbi:hypothetical protein [Desulfovibrio inopinatus]|nr:hypothetical protein [Desulfovibrio inopinatus]